MNLGDPDGLWPGKITQIMGNTDSTALQLSRQQSDNSARGARG
jgi:hypothetical protein